MSLIMVFTQLLRTLQNQKLSLSELITEGHAVSDFIALDVSEYDKLCLRERHVRKRVHLIFGFITPIAIPF